MIASKWFDPVLGIDIHIVLMPTPAGPVPTPLPMPFVGIVFDPAGMAFGMIMSTVLGGGPSFTLVNGLPATNTGTAATNKLTLPHLPVPGIAFQKGMPSMDADLMFGGLKVSFGGSHIVRLGDIALSCSDPMRMPTSVVLAIPLGSLVIVPRPPSPDLMGLVFAAGGKLVAKLASKAAKLGKALFRRMRAAQRLSKTWAKASERLMAREGGKLGRARAAWNRAVCFLTGHPVDVATGRVLTDHLELELPGALPLRFERFYDSSLSGRRGPLGQGWSHSLDQAVWPERGRVVYRSEDGREVEFITLDLPDRVLRPGQSLYHPVERLTLRCREPRHYEVEDARGVVREFVGAQGEATGHVAPIVRKRSRGGHSHTYGYDPQGRLVDVTDGAGRKLLLAYDRRGRLVAVELVGIGGERSKLAEYVHDGADDLVEAKDALGQSFRYEYVGHLLVKETNRNGLAFYFQYDGLGSAARCVRTWGDGGLYDHAITYDTANRRTLVENSLGAITLYQLDDANQVVAITDALGTVTRYTYDDRSGQKISETDPTGATTRWRYDQRGNCVEVSRADGGQMIVEYDERDLPLRAVDAMGGEWRWGYDPKGRVIGRVDPLQHRTQYQWHDGRLVGLTDPLGQQTSVEYDAAGNIAAVTAPDGTATRWQYDGIGRCHTAIDAKGNRQRREHDALGRVVRVADPDGNGRELSYDAESNLVRFRDRQHEVHFRYQGMGRLASRTEAGHTVSFEYDTEEQLTSIHNELGRTYSFEVGPTGKVAVEWDWAGRRRQYLRDAAGRVSRLLRPSGIVSRYEYDALGRVAAIDHGDGTAEAFQYRPDGSLIEAANESATVRLERDLLGRVLKEQIGDDWVASEYDGRGSRIRLWSSRGLDERIRRNALGDVIGVRAVAGADAPAWEAQFKRDELGLELERDLPGGVQSRWERDRVGRPLRQEIWCGGVMTRGRQYHWETNDRLRTVVDSLSGAVQYTHDALGNLASAIYADGRVDLRLPDAVGNLFRSEDRSDRKYGLAGELLEASGPNGVTRYDYDPDGNLSKKTEPGGRVWTYRWNGAGMLAAVTRPDGAVVTFGYDPFGRRLWKKLGGRTTRWVWDGGVPLHEWVEEVVAPAVPASPRADAGQKARDALLVSQPAQGPPDAPITWLFEPHTFSPIAKLVGNERFSVITDHLGAPTALHDENGAVVWSAHLDSYGELRNLVGERTLCPFRWPGQYEDVETGLYYNRFRYYDPAGGAYVSKDPLGIRGGLALYAYVNDPLTGSDPAGLMDCTRATKQAQKTIDEANLGRLRRSPDYHGRLPPDVEADILKSPENVFFSEGQSNRLIFHKDGNVVVTETGSRRGQIVTSYGDKGPRGESGAAVFGGKPEDPGLPINAADIEAGTIPAPGGGTLPPATRLPIGGTPPAATPGGAT